MFFYHKNTHTKVNCVCFRISDKFDNELRQPRYTNNSTISRKKINSKAIIVVKHDQITEVQAYIYVRSKTTSINHRITKCQKNENNKKSSLMDI
jgi:N6-adenosine-specific RNA methylase IME4